MYPNIDLSIKTIENNNKIAQFFKFGRTCFKYGKQENI